jgi:hypothetical protein
VIERSKATRINVYDDVCTLAQAQVPRPSPAEPSVGCASDRNLSSTTQFCDGCRPDTLNVRPPDMSHRPEKRRRIERVAAACDLCKKRKVKCNGEQPCAYCTRKDHASTCTFSGPAARSQVQSTSHTPGRGAGADAITPHHHALSADQTPISRESDQQEHTLQRSRNRNDPAIDTSLSPTLSRDDQHQGDTAVPLEGRILRDAQGKLIFIGDCAPISFLQTVRHLITSEVQPEASVQTDRDPIIEITHPKLITGRYCPPIDILLVNLLVDGYTDATCGLVQLSNPDILSKELKSWVSSGDPGRSSEDARTAVFYLVLAIGAQEKFEEKAEGWFDHARELLLKCMCSNMNVSTVQGFTLVAIFMLRASQPNGAYLYFCKED